MKNYTTKEIEAIIVDFKNCESHSLTVVADSSYSVKDDINNLYQRLRYFSKKKGGIRVSREYNTIILNKTV